MLSIRKIGVIGRTYRHLNRYRQILSVFFRYGFGDLLELLNIDQYIEAGLRMISRNRKEQVEKLSRPERVRMACEELGPTFIKLGQAASTRPDLIPIHFNKEFSKLQDEVPPFPYYKVKEIIKAELGDYPENLFEFFNEIPLASASIGQVHVARLSGNKEVVVKVQRPGIRKTIEVDLEILLYLATLMERNVDAVSLQRPVKIIEEFANIVSKELDYSIEAANMERFERQFIHDKTIYVPKVYRGMTTKRVITMEYVDGIKVSCVSKLKSAGLDLKKITTRGTDITLKQIFDHGFFHADPHPGNIFILKENVICLVDFGMVGAVDSVTKEIFVDLIDGIVRRNPLATANVLLKLTYWDEEPNIRSFEKELADFMSQHLYKPLKDIKIGQLLQHLLELVFRHQLRIPPDIFLMIKAVSAIEGIASQLDPEFDMIKHAAPFITKVKLARFHPGRITDDLTSIGSDLHLFIKQFPKDILEIARLIKQKKLNFQVEHQGFEEMLVTHDQISNRISFSIIIAALLIGSALIVISKTPPLFYGISLIGIVGFLAAAIMGIWLLVAIIRKGRL